MPEERPSESGDRPAAASPREAALARGRERLVDLGARHGRPPAERHPPASEAQNSSVPLAQPRALNDTPEHGSSAPADARVRRLPPDGPKAAGPAALGRPAMPVAADPFWRVWLAHREHLRRQSLRLMSGNMADAEDALSAAMLKASQKFAEYADSIVNERAWLSRLLHNACMDVYRMQRKQARWISEQPSDEELESNRQPLVPTERSPEELALGREQIAQLQDQVVQLPASLRRPFLMRFVQNLSYEEIAAELNLTNAAVRKRIQLARERLRRGLNW